MTSPIVRFRHPCDDGTGAMPYAIAGSAKCRAFRLLGPLRPGVGLVSYGAPTNGAEESRLVYAQQCRHRRVAHGWVETVEQDLKVRHLKLLGWSVGSLAPRSR